MGLDIPDLNDRQKKIKGILRDKTSIVNECAEIVHTQNKSVQNHQQRKIRGLIYVNYRLVVFQKCHFKVKMLFWEGLQTTSQQPVLEQDIPVVCPDSNKSRQNRKNKNLDFRRGWPHNINNTPLEFKKSKLVGRNHIILQKLTTYFQSIILNVKLPNSSIKISNLQTLVT